MSKDAEPSPSTTAAWSTAVGTPDVEQDAADLDARGQVRREHLVVRVQPAEVDDARDALLPRPPRRSASPPRGRALRSRAVVHRVHEVPRGVDIRRAPAACRPRGADVALGDLDPVDPRPVVDRGAAPGQHPDGPALVEQPGDDLAADIAGGAGHEGQRPACWRGSGSQGVVAGHGITWSARGRVGGAGASRSTTSRA